MRYELLDGGEVELDAHFLSPDEAAALFLAVHAAVSWQSRDIRIAGRWLAEPRLTAWIGDPDAAYTYSGRLNVPEAWPEVLLALRQRVCDVARESFNSVLCNLYRDGRDSMGFHADKEPELGPTPLLASLSLGATRRFQLRHRKQRESRLDLDLVSGSLLIMRGTLQQHYRHGVPKQASVSSPRINLTFRRIVSGVNRAVERSRASGVNRAVERSRASGATRAAERSRAPERDPGMSALPS